MSLLLIFLQFTTGSIIFLNPYEAIRPKRNNSEQRQSGSLLSLQPCRRTVIDRSFAGPDYGVFSSRSRFGSPHGSSVTRLDGRDRTVRFTHLYNRRSS
jgi:hypothetical protein